MLGLLRTGLNPFDPKTVFLAKHAQHVVLVHFPIALFVTAVVFDAMAHRTKQRAFADAAYYNLFLAAIATLPVIVTGILAWQFQLEGQKIKGLLRLHLVLAGISSLMIWLIWWLHLRGRQNPGVLPSFRFVIELVAVALVGVTAHLGGFLSGVNGPG